jgi:hypothetical protein
MITNNDSFDDLSTLHRSEFECVIDVLAFTNRLCKLIFALWKRMGIKRENQYHQRTNLEQLRDLMIHLSERSGEYSTFLHEIRRHTFVVEKPQAQTNDV